VQDLVLAWPDDIEAKAALALAAMFAPNRYGNELIVREVLARQPDHPGAHHYRIHNWDTLELCVRALPSAARYGCIAPAVGHANHMPARMPMPSTSRRKASRPHWSRFPTATCIRRTKW
jgi:hypothetical protein